MATSVRDFEASSTDIDGLWVLRPKRIADDRGVISELFRASALAEAGIADPGPWRQVNLTATHWGGIRGMHGEDMVKLVGVVAGEAFGAYVDCRPGSATRGVVVSLPLEIGVHVLVPAGVCNGFQALSEEPAQYLYCFTSEWRPDLPGPAVHPLDPDLGIQWPIAIDPGDVSHLSAKDAGLPSLREVLGDG